MTGDLRQQLTEALDAAEKLVRAAFDRDKPGDEEWRQDDPVREPGLVRSSAGYVVTYDEGYPTQEQAAHIARWDPSTALRLIERDRRMVERHRPYDDDSVHRSPITRCFTDEEGWPCDEILDAAAFWLGTPEVDR